MVCSILHWYKTLILDWILVRKMRGPVNTFNAFIIQQMPILFGHMRPGSVQHQKENRTQRIRRSTNSSKISLWYLSYVRLPILYCWLWQWLSSDMLAQIISYSPHVRGIKRLIMTFTILTFSSPPPSFSYKRTDTSPAALSIPFYSLFELSTCNGCAPGITSMLLRLCWETQ